MGAGPAAAVVHPGRPDGRPGRLRGRPARRADGAVGAGGRGRRAGAGQAGPGRVGRPLRELLRAVRHRGHRALARAASCRCRPGCGARPDSAGAKKTSTERRSVTSWKRWGTVRATNSTLPGPDRVVLAGQPAAGPGRRGPRRPRPPGGAPGGRRPPAQARTGRSSSSRGAGTRGTARRCGAAPRPGPPRGRRRRRPRRGVRPPANPTRCFGRAWSARYRERRCPPAPAHGASAMKICRFIDMTAAATARGGTGVGSGTWTGRWSCRWRTGRGGRGWRRCSTWPWRPTPTRGCGPRRMGSRWRWRRCGCSRRWPSRRRSGTSTPSSSTCARPGPGGGWRCTRTGTSCPSSTSPTRRRCSARATRWPRRPARPSSTTSWRWPACSAAAGPTWAWRTPTGPSPGSWS